MCGIIGYLGFRPVGKILHSGLKALEYRGYDSAGVAVIEGGAAVRIVKDTGKVDEINSSLKFDSLEGHAGIAHTRWATHGGVGRVRPAERLVRVFGVEFCKSERAYGGAQRKPADSGRRGERVFRGERLHSIFVLY